MYESLTQIKSKFEELQTLLDDPTVTANIKRYTKISQELNTLNDVVTTFQTYLEIEELIHDSKAILDEESDLAMIVFAKQEISSAEKKLPTLEANLKVLLLPNDPNDQKNVIVEIRGAAGGEEGNIFAGDLFRMYQKWVGANNLKINVLNSSVALAGGFSQIIFNILGQNVFSKLKFETGSHRVQRIPKTETQGRIHTSTATVLVMPEADEEVKIELKANELKIDTYRSSGAGGQSVNTTDSAVRITHLPTGVMATSQDGKSQTSNRELAMKVLKTRLYDLELRKKQTLEGQMRKKVGTGDRSEKIRTYNYPQDRVTDHRISYSTSLKKVLDGGLNNLIELLISAEQAAKIKAAGLGN